MYDGAFHEARRYEKPSPLAIPCPTPRGIARLAARFSSGTTHLTSNSPRADFSRPSCAPRRSASTGRTQEHLLGKLSGISHPHPPSPSSRSCSFAIRLSGTLSAATDGECLRSGRRSAIPERVPVTRHEDRRIGRVHMRRHAVSGRQSMTDTDVIDVRVRQEDGRKRASRGRMRAPPPHWTRRQTARRRPTRCHRGRRRYGAQVPIRCSLDAARSTRPFRAGDAPTWPSDAAG